MRDFVSKGICANFPPAPRRTPPRNSFANMDALHNLSLPVFRQPVRCAEKRTPHPHMTTAFLLTLADAAAPAPASPMNSLAIPMLAMGVIFYFLIIRPQNKRQSDLKSLLTSLKTGDKVVTNGGIHGIIANVKEGSTLILKVADNVKIEINKDAIASVVKDAATPAA